MTAPGHTFCLLKLPGTPNLNNSGHSAPETTIEYFWGSTGANPCYFVEVSVNDLRQLTFQIVYCNHPGLPGRYGEHLDILHREFFLFSSFAFLCSRKCINPPLLHSKRATKLDAFSANKREFCLIGVCCSNKTPFNINK